MLKLHIFLVGMAGAGKTSLGKKIAQNLGIEFVDTDQRISEIFGMSIGEIFSSGGKDPRREGNGRFVARAGTYHDGKKLGI